MGWGTQYTANMYITREMFRTPEDVRSAIEDEDWIINKAKAELNALAFANPKDITPPDETPLYYVQGLMEETLEILEDHIISRYRKQLLIDNWDTKVDDSI